MFLPLVVLLSATTSLLGVSGFVVVDKNVNQKCRFESELFASVPADSLELCRQRCQMMENCRAFNWNGAKCEVTDQTFAKNDAVDIDNDAAFCGIVNEEESRLSGNSCSYHKVQWLRLKELFGL